MNVSTFTRNTCQSFRILFERWWRMVESLVNEEVWAGALKDLPAWAPPRQPLLIIAPHPDDETLGAGGFIAAQRLQGVDVMVAAVTDGENAYPGSPEFASPEFAELRRREQTNALARLGVHSARIIRLRLTDSNVTSREQELMEMLSPLVTGDTHIVAPWRGDFHPDHEACGRAAEQIALRTGARLTSYFFWTWHFGETATLDHLQLVAFPLTPDLLLAKSEALQCHGSQLEHESGEPILPERLLAPARRPFEVFSLA